MYKITDCKELALKKVSITGNVLGKFGTFEIEQKYINNTKNVLEVEYTFPIIESATVTGFEVLVGEKLLKGVCKETKKAKKEYKKNIDKGNSAYLLEEQSDNIFSIYIGKLDIDEAVTIKIKFIDKFVIVDNKIQILIPTLVPPKYNCEITEKLNYGAVDYNVDFNINVFKNINVQNITSATHKIHKSEDNDKTIVQILNYDMSKDFKLELELKEEMLSSGILKTNNDGKDIIYLSFMPEITDIYEDNEKEYLFLIDVSGSMMGEKLEETKNAVIECLKQLDNGDKFNIIDFENNFRVMSRRSLDYNEENLKKAIKHVNSLFATGGTEIFEPIKFALDYNNNEKTIMLFTDGEVGNEEEIIEYIRQNIGTNRIFPFGIDTNVNTFFINDVAHYGNGKSEFIAPNEKIDDKIIRTFARIQTPLIENLTIDYGKNSVIDEIRESNALFNFEFYNAFVKVDKLTDDIVLKGNILDKEYSWVIKKDNIIISDTDLDLLFIKEEIERLENRIRYSYSEKEAKKHIKKIIKLSEKYNVNSKYTSFLTVYERNNKILNTPIYQKTTLSNRGLFGSIKDHFCSLTGNAFHDCCHDDCDNYCFAEDIELSVRDYSYLNRRSTPSTIELLETPYNKLCEQLNDFYLLVDSVLTKLLYAYWFILTEQKEFNFDAFLEYIKSNLEEIRQNEDCSGVLILCYRATNDERLYNLLSDVDKNYAKTSAIVNINIHKMEKYHLKQFVEDECYKNYTDIGLWYLCNNELERTNIYQKIFN